MDAGLQFRELLNQIENSKLNYVMTKTPFSANISIKRSLIKFHDKKSSEKEELDVKEENAELKNKLVNVSEQNIMFQELLKQQSEKVKALESEMVNLRKELLNEKKEKNAQKKEISDLKHKSVKSEQTMKDLEAEVKEKAKTVRIKDAACMNFKSEKEESERSLNEAFNELKS
jgi:chromosome segregation ATPase